MEYVLTFSSLFTNIFWVKPLCASQVLAGLIVTLRKYFPNPLYSFLQCSLLPQGSFLLHGDNILLLPKYFSNAEFLKILFWSVWVPSSERWQLM